ncbi:hypothetical protein, partial [uncultured Sphingobacterium sp.]|uniref:hypothetical protein n=1 Tax=uncultured Sphingobacterium sp. TaxID=182688 RepID=UPI0025E7AFD4
IPNRAVKPARADGIAVTGGRVGRCLFLHGSPCWKQSRASFVWIHTSVFPCRGYCLSSDYGYRSTGPWVSPVQRQLLRNRRYPATLLLDNRLHFIIALLLRFFCCP